MPLQLALSLTAIYQTSFAITSSDFPLLCVWILRWMCTHQILLASVIGLVNEIGLKNQAKSFTLVYRIPIEYKMTVC